jgi:hypothetical protein
MPDCLGAYCSLTGALGAYCSPFLCCHCGPWCCTVLQGQVGASLWLGSCYTVSHYRTAWCSIACCHAVPSKYVFGATTCIVARQACRLKHVHVHCNCGACGHRLSGWTSLWQFFVLSACTLRARCSFPKGRCWGCAHCSVGRCSLPLRGAAQSCASHLALMVMVAVLACACPCTGHLPGAAAKS